MGTEADGKGGMSETVRAHIDAEPRRPRIVAIGGGKGGCGKTLVSACLGHELARRGLKAVLVDCDLGGANLHSLLGLEYPQKTLSDFVLRRCESLGELVVPTSAPGLGLISGARNAIQVANPMHQQKVRLLRAVSELDADVVVLDLGAGTHYNVVDFFLLANDGMVIVAPEPTSVENAYRFIKATFLRRMKAVVEDHGLREVLVGAGGHGGVTPAELLALLEAHSPVAGFAVRRELAAYRPFLVVNQTREPRDSGLGEAMVEASRRFFGVGLAHLGDLRYADQVWRAVRARGTDLLQGVGPLFASDVASLATRLLAASGSGTARRHESD